jgi:hypothetical protein
VPNPTGALQGQSAAAEMAIRAGSHLGGQASVKELSAAARPDRQNLFGPVLPQFEGNSSDGYTPVLRTGFSGDLNERVNQIGEGAALGWCKLVSRGWDLLVLAICADRQRAKSFGLGRPLQINSHSPLHGSIMRLCLIFSSSC